MTVYVVLHVPQCPEDDLKLYLSRLDLKVEVWATSNSQPTERSPGSGPARDLICSHNVDLHDDPIVLVSQREKNDEIYLSLLWEVPVTLNRPRLQLYDVHVAFIPVALIAPQQETTPKETYLEPFQPQAGNLFEPLGGSPGYEQDIPYLAISRLDSVLPLLPKDDHTFHLRSVPSRSIPTHLACSTRLKYSKSSIDDLSPSFIASLDIEMIPFVNIQGQIDLATARLDRGKVYALMDTVLPIGCQSKDCITLLYRLEQKKVIEGDSHLGSGSHVDNLAIRIKVKLQLSDDCESIIDMQWTTNIDFGSTINRTSIGSAVLPHQRESTPNMPVNGAASNSSKSIGMSLQQHAPGGQYDTFTISFAATDKPIKVGVPFVWSVLVVNKTSKPAKLAVIPLPRLQKPTTQVQQYAKRHATRSSVISLHPSERGASDKEQPDIAQAVMDENVIYAMQHSGAVPPETDIMSLTPELRIGPLGPGQCHEGEIKLVAFKPGAFTLDAIRVVDLVKEMELGYGGSGVVMDIKELPDVIVEDDK